MINKISSILKEAEKLIASVDKSTDLESLRVRFLGRKGELTLILRGLKDLPATERIKIGQIANNARNQLLEFFTLAENKLSNSVKPIDVGLPGISPSQGHLHLVTEAISDITAIFKEIGFTRVRHPEIESEWYPFEALNVPGDHPARDEWETFFMDSKGDGKYRFVLTPHGTSGTARSIAMLQPPIRSINIQKCYRRQSDGSHAPMFHQFDGVCVEKGMTIQHLKGTLEYFVKSFFGSDREVRLRPHHFRFTEPSFEVDISCGYCNGKACKLCKDGWVELGGSGMLHPNVLKMANIDPKQYTAFAFGWGVERNLLMRSGLDIPDLRILYENDLRFLEQF